MFVRQIRQCNLMQIRTCGKNHLNATLITLPDKIDAHYPNVFTLYAWGMQDKQDFIKKFH